MLDLILIVGGLILDKREQDSRIAALEAGQAVVPRCFNRGHFRTLNSGLCSECADAGRRAKGGERR